MKLGEYETQAADSEPSLLYYYQRFMPLIPLLSVYFLKFGFLFEQYSWSETFAVQHVSKVNAWNFCTEAIPDIQKPQALYQAEISS